MPMADEPVDWCPSCGESLAEHDEEQAARCTEAFYATELLIQRAIAQSTEKAHADRPEARPVPPLQR